MNEQRSPEPQNPQDLDPGSDPEALDRQRVLGARLRTLFDGVVDEPVPDAFAALLDKLGDGPEQP